MVEAFVEANGLVKRFGRVTAVDNISLSVPKGQVLGFLGPNGAGKTTSMRMITGYLSSDAGNVSICGHNILTSPIKARQHLGYLPEGAPLYPDMSADEFLSFCGQARGMRRDLLEARKQFVREELQLQSVWKRPIEELSKGFKRRVGLAQAILHDPDVLILDEPTDGLDPVQKHEVRQLITQMAPEKAIIISTHILEEVDAVCNQAVIIVRGRIAAHGTPAELIARSAHHKLDNLFLELAQQDKDAQLSATPHDTDHSQETHA
jgi:ABC-2 type transport system ATP-binding protein